MFGIKRDVRNRVIRPVPKAVAIRVIASLSTAETGNMKINSAGVRGRLIEVKIELATSNGMNDPNPKMKSATAGTYSGYFIANSLFYTLSVLFVLGTGVSYPVRAIATVAYGIPAPLLILVDETDDGFADIDSASVSIQNI